MSIVNEERNRYSDEQVIEAAENLLAENVKLYIIAGLLANHQVVAFDRDTYLVRGVWSQDYVLRGFRTLDLPFEVDEWIGCEQVDSSPTADLLYSSRYYSCRLVAAEPSKSSAVLPHKLKKRLMLEMHEWQNPRGAFEVLTRRVTHALDRVNESRAALEANDDAWAEAYAFLESLEEVFL